MLWCGKCFWGSGVLFAHDAIDVCTFRIHPETLKGQVLVGQGTAPGVTDETGDPER